MASIFDISIIGIDFGAFEPAFVIEFPGFKVSFSEEAIEDLEGEFGFDLAGFTDRLLAGDFDALLLQKTQEGNRPLVTTAEMVDFRRHGRINLQGIPAADRIVARSDNLAALDEAVEHVDRLEAALRSNNELAVNKTEAVEVAKNEISLFRTMLNQTVMRARSVKNYAISIFSWMLLAFAGTFFSELVAPIIKAIFSVF